MNLVIPTPQTQPEEIPIKQEQVVQENQQIQQYSGTIFNAFSQIQKEELAGILLFQKMWIQACGASTEQIQSIAVREEKKSSDNAKECAKYSIVLLGGDAASNNSILPCEETLKIIQSTQGLRNIIQLAYQWTTQTRILYLQLYNLLKEDHPDIASWGVESAKEKIESFYSFQSLLS